MFCPNCGTQNPDTGKFCSSCGNELQTRLPEQRPFSQPSIQFTIPKPASPLKSAATTGGLTGMAGGAICLIGWLIGGGLPILTLIFAGGVVTGSLAGDAIGLLFLLLTFVLAGIVVFIPITGMLCVRTGISLFELRAYNRRTEIHMAKGELRLLRSRATKILIMLFLMASFITVNPFIGQALLGQGFWLMMGGAITTFLGALFARSQIGPEPVSTTQPSIERELNEEQMQVLLLLSEGSSLKEIAERLNISTESIQSTKLSLLSYFDAEDTTLLIKRARAQGILPPT